MDQEIRGDLENTRCPEIIKILSLGKRTGRLLLNKGAETGNIYFQDGNIVHAKCGTIEGLKAIFELTIWTAGEYSFFVDDRPDNVTIDMALDTILSEASERIRQMDRITSLIPSSNIVYALEPDISEPEFSLKSIQWRVISNINGERSISDIAQMIGLTVFDAMKVFYTLVKLGLLHEAVKQEAKRRTFAIDLPETPFIQALKEDLTTAIGPIAPYIIQETSEEMNYNLLTNDIDERAAFIETLSSKIVDEEMSLNFLNVMTDWLRTGDI